jgi:hypothetical protein
MKSKFIIISTLLISAIVLSGCTLKDQVELKILNKINNKVDQKIEEVNQESGNDTEETLLKDLNSDTNASYDSDLNQIQTEVQ